jgi:hypothetical protein
VPRSPDGNHDTYQGESQDQGHRSRQAYQVVLWGAVVLDGEDDRQAGQGEANQAQQSSKPRRPATLAGVLSTGVRRAEMRRAQQASTCAVPNFSYADIISLR